MPIHVHWDNDEKTILMEVFEGRWVIEDYYRMIDEAVERLAEVSHTVHIIADATQSTMPPTQIMIGMQYALKRIPSNQGLTVFVKLNRVMLMFVEVARQISPTVAKSTYMADTVEEARRLIAEKGNTFKTGNQ